MSTSLTWFEEPKQQLKFSHKFVIVAEGAFLECLQALKDAKCIAMYGPSGGILELNEDGCLVYAARLHDLGKLYFSADSYLGVWRLLRAENKSSK